MFVVGAPGIGKSVLVDAVVAATGRATIRLDARRVEPTPVAFLEASSLAVGHPAASPTELGEAMQHEGISLLVIDGYEHLQLIDDWLRDQLVPSLPALSTTVIVTRTPPNIAWRTGEWRQLVQEVEVGPMSEHDATELVAQHIGRGDATERVLRFGAVILSALHLAADAVARRPDLMVNDGPPPEVVEELVDLFLDDLPPDLRTVVQDVSLLRRATLPMLDGAASQTRHLPSRSTSSGRICESSPSCRSARSASSSTASCRMSCHERRTPRPRSALRSTVRRRRRVRRSRPSSRMSHRRPAAPRAEPCHS